MSFQKEKPSSRKPKSAAAEKPKEQKTRSLADPKSQPRSEKTSSPGLKANPSSASKKRPI